MIQGSSGFNIDITTDVFKAANSQHKSVEIVYGNVSITGSPKSNSSISELDYFVRKHILNQDLSSSQEKQILLLKEIEIYYKGLEEQVNKTREVIKDSSLAGTSKSRTKVNAVSDQIAKTSKQLGQRLTLLQQNITKRKEEYEAKRNTALNIFLNVCKLRSKLDLVDLTFEEFSHVKLEKHIYNLGMKDADLSEDAQTLESLYKGNFPVLRAQNAASYTDHLLYRILFEGDFSSGIHTDEDIEGLLRLSQQRKNILDYCLQLETLSLQRGNPKFTNYLNSLITTIQKNIQLLADPPSDKIATVKDTHSFVLPGGWVKNPNYPHYISYEIKKEGEDYYFLIHNRGLLANAFPQLHNNISFKDASTGKTYSKTTACIKTTKEALTDPAFIQKLINNYINSQSTYSVYQDIQKHFIESGKGSVIQSETEKELEKIFKKISESTGKEKQVLNTKALELMKKDSHFQSQQLYGTCTESNIATAEMGISSTHTLECVEKYMLAHMVDKLARKILNPASKANEINMVLLKKHVDQRINQLKRKIEALPINAKGGPTTVFKDTYLFKHPLTEAERKPFIDGINRGILKLRYLPKFLKNDREIVLAALTKNPLNIQYAPESFKGDQALILSLKKQNPLSLIYAADHLKETLLISPEEKLKFIEAIQKGEITLQSLPKQLQNDREIVLASVEKDGLAVQHASKPLQEDLEIARASIKQNILALDFISNKIPLSELLSKAQKISLIIQIEKGERTLNAIPEILKNDEEIALAVVRKNGLSFKDLPDSIKANEKIALAAVEQNGLAFPYVAQNLKENVQIVQAALKQNIYVFDYLSPKILAQPFIKALIEEIKKDILNGKKTFSSLPRSLKLNIELVMAEVTRNGLDLAEAMNHKKD